MVPAIIIVLAVAAILILNTNASGQQFDSTGDSTVYLTDNQIEQIAASTSAKNKAFAQAIAVAEGYQDQNGNVLSGNIPAQAHNPLDLEIPGWTGAKLGAEGISVFLSDSEGWARGYRQLNLISSGQSANYSLSDTISTMAAKWTDTNASDWAKNVAAYLGVSVDTPLSSLLE